jgi:hypothetical protein
MTFIIWGVSTVMTIKQMERRWSKLKERLVTAER